MSATKLVTIYGGSGFLGRQIARVMAAQGWRIRVAVRRPNEAGVVRTYGAPGQIEPVPCNVRDDLSVRACMADADAVINCVGILVREGKNTFEAIHDEAAGRIARIAAETGIRATTAPDAETALRRIVAESASARVLICGSLYLAGHILRQNG